MTETRYRRPQVEPLEDRTVLSAGLGLAHAVHPLGTHHGHHARHHHHHGLPGNAAPGQNGPVGTLPGAAAQMLALSGQVSGTWQIAPTVGPFAGEVQILRGGGVVSPLGTVQMTGVLNVLGPIGQGETLGTVTLSNAAGSVTLRFVGPPQQGLGALPANFHYTITGGTGQYAGASGSGAVAFAEHQGSRPVCPPGALCPQPVGANTFTMTFIPAAA
jgi:hypothetical protein